MKTHSPNKKASSANEVAAGINVGVGEQSTISLNPYIDYGRRLNARWNFHAKITGTYASGFLGNTFNAGDIFLVSSFHPKIKNENITFLAAFKIPLTTSNDKNLNGKPLPLDYQSSLGTYDLVGGISYLFKKRIDISAGVQIPVINNNKNSFFTDEYSDTRVNNFASTNLFERKPDALLRLGYFLPIQKQSISIKPNLLFIYHLGDDNYTNRFNTKQAITGSNGLTLNAGINLVKTFANKNELELIAATPLIVRDVRADGLTRSAVLNIQYKVAF